MNLRTACRIRSAAGYHPGKTPAQYEPLEIHHLAEAPVYETYERTLRSWDPKRKKIVSRKVTKIRYGADGRTPLSPLMQLVDVPGGDPAKPEKRHVPVTQLLSIAKPVRLKKGSPKAIYRMLKKLERTVGLDNVYAQLQAEMEAAA